MTRPTTVTEWHAYVGTLTGQDLWSKTIAVNTQRFVDSIIRRDGRTMAEAQAIITMFARRIEVTEGRFPEGGAFDLQNLARRLA